MSNEIGIPNSDGKIWDIERRTIEILRQWVHYGRIEITLNSEGPDAEHLGLYRLLDSMCDAFSIDKTKVTIHTRNLLEEHPVYNIKKLSPFHLVNTLGNVPVVDKSIKSHFGMFVRRSDWARLYLASALHSKHLHKSVITYHYDFENEWHSNHFGLDTLVSEIGPAAAINAVSSIMQSMPITLSDFADDHVRNPTDLADYYTEFLIEIVSETYLSGRTFFPTEKTWRPIMLKTPFLVNGPCNYLENLRRLGFKTFSQWWDESYDWQPGKTKIEEIVKIIDMMALKSVQELEVMYNEMLPTLEHNYTVLKNLTSAQMATANYVK